MADRVLEVDRLSKRYGEVTALQDMSFIVRAGELFGFVGSNGAARRPPSACARACSGVLPGVCASPATTW
jgi:ABC-type branched-subunit amino acid transport system ATPase component